MVMPDLPAIDYPLALREVRERTGLSQPKFADLVGLSRRTVSKWERLTPETAAPPTSNPGIWRIIVALHRSPADIKVDPARMPEEWARLLRVVASTVDRRPPPGATHVPGTPTGSPPSSPRRAPKTASRTPGRMALFIGRTTEGAEFAWDPTAAPNPHAYITGASGAGKSVTLRRLLLGLAKKKVPGLLFDVEGEFSDIASNTGWELSDPIAGVGPAVNLIESRNESERIDLVDAFSAAFGLGEIQASALLEVLRDFDRTKTHHDLVQALPEKPANLRARLAPLGVVWRGAEATGGVAQLAKRGGVVQLQAAPSSIRVPLVILLLAQAYAHVRRWKPSKKLRLVIIVDEAHQLGTSPKLIRLVERMTRELRKRGVALWFASQQLNDIGAATLNSIDTLMIMRTSERLPRELAAANASPAGLDVGEALVWQGRQDPPLRVKVEAVEVEESAADRVARTWDMTVAQRYRQVPELSEDLKRSFAEGPVPVDVPAGTYRRGGREWRVRDGKARLIKRTKKR